MDARRIDQNTGEVLDQEQPQEGVDYTAALVQAMSRSERLLARQDSLLDENKRLREELERQKKYYSEAKAEFHTRLAEAQAEFEVMRRDNRVQFKAKKSDTIVKTDTASMESAAEAVGKSLTSRGISLRQPVVDHPTDRNVAFVQTILAYRGYEESHNVSIRSAYSYSVNGLDIKAFGAEVSLVRKYALFAALGLVQETKEGGNSNVGQNSHSQGSGTQGGHSRQPSGNSGAAHNSEGMTADQVKQLFDQADSVQELAKAMNSIPMDVRKESGAQALFNQRRMQLQGQPLAA